MMTIDNAVYFDLNRRFQTQLKSFSLCLSMHTLHYHIIKLLHTNFLNTDQMHVEVR